MTYADNFSCRKTGKQLTVAFCLTGGEVQVETQGQHFGVGQGTCLVQAGQCRLLFIQPRDKDKDDDRSNGKNKDKDSGARRLSCAIILSVHPFSYPHFSVRDIHKHAGRG